MKIAVINEKQREYVLRQFQQHPACDYEIACFVEYKPKKDMDGSIPVIALSALAKTEFDAVLIAVERNRYVARLLAYLHDQGIANIYIVRLFALDKSLDFLGENGFIPQCVDHFNAAEDKPYLVHLETHICDHCNLNCKACNNFSPFYKERSCASAEEYERDLQQLLQLFSMIGRLFLLGGEPLQEPELCCRFITISRKYFPKAELRLLTNGLLIPKMTESLWEVVRTNDVIVHISAYLPTMKLMPQIEDVLNRARVKWIVVGPKRKGGAQKQAEYCTDQKVTITALQKFIKHWTDSPLEDREKNNHLCGSAGCHYLRSGKIWKCPDAGLIKNLDEAFGTHLQSRDFLLLEEIKDGWTAIRHLNGPTDLCSYCTFDRKELVEWEVVHNKPELSDWLVKNRLQYERKEWDQQRKAAARIQAELKAQCISQEENNTRLSAQVEDLKKKNSALTMKMCDFKRTNGALNMQIEKLENRNCATVKKMADTEARYYDVVHSHSYKVGRTVLWLPRQVKLWYLRRKENKGSNI